MRKVALCFVVVLGLVLALGASPALADTVGPTLTGLTPAAGGTVAGNVTVTVSATDTDKVASVATILIDQVTYSASAAYGRLWNGTKYVTDYTRATFTLYPTNVPYGTRSLTLKVKDALNNLTTQTTTFLHAAKLTYSAQTPANASTNRDVTEVKVSVAPGDALDAATLTMTLDGASVTPTVTPGTATVPAVVTLATHAANGTHTVVLTAQDIYGAVPATTTWKFSVAGADFTPPELSLASRTPEPGAILATNYVGKVGATFTDPAGVDRTKTRAFLDETPLPVDAQNGYWQGTGAARTWVNDPTYLGVLSLQSLTLHDGLHTLRLQVADTLGNSTDYSWSFTVRVPPQIANVLPVPGGTTTSAEVTVSATLTDYDGFAPADQTIEYRQANSPSTVSDWHALASSFNQTTGRLEATASSTDLPVENRYEFRLRAKDAAGNQTEALTDVYWKTNDAQMAASTDCVRCHPPVAHPMSSCVKCHDRDCSECHPDHTSAVLTGKCVNCHPLHGETGLAQAHRVDVTVPCLECHKSSLTTEHEGRTTSTGTLIDCYTCHESQNPTIQGAITAKDTRCYTCHPEKWDGSAVVSHGYDPLLHLSTEICFGSCHDQELKPTHDAATGSDFACSNCHPAKVAEITPWDKTCGACHPTIDHTTVGSTSKHIGDDSTINSVGYFGIFGCGDMTNSAGKVLQQGCHAVGDVTAIHKWKHQVDANGQWSALPREGGGCTICHGTGQTPTTECNVCHPATGPTGPNGDPSYRGTLHMNNPMFMNNPADSVGVPPPWYETATFPANGWNDGVWGGTDPDTYFYWCINNCHPTYMSGY